MKNKTKVIMIAFPTLLAFGLYITLNGQANSLMSKWGQILKQYSETISDKATEIYMKGKSATVTEADIQQGTELFILSGMDREKAKKEAINYAMKREALYEEAIKSGYTVTDDEVRTYLKELKKTIDSADNKEDAYATIDAFGSEKEYWDFEFTVYKKDLPIKKYRDSLEQQYNANNITLIKQVSDIDYNEDFDSFFEKYKTKLVEEQNYKQVR